MIKEIIGLVMILMGKEKVKKFSIMKMEIFNMKLNILMGKKKEFVFGICWMAKFLKNKNIKIIYFMEKK